MLKTPAIVLSSMKYGETSLILQMYTREEGRASFIVSGVRKNKAKVPAALLLPGSICEVMAYYKPGDRLNRIKEIKPSIIYQNIPFRVYKRAVCIFCTELLNKTILERDASPELFDFLFQYFSILDQTEMSVANFPIYLMRELSTFLGFSPNDNYADSDPYFDLIDGLYKPQAPAHRHYIKAPLSLLFHRLLRARIDNLDLLELSRSDRNDLLNTWIDYFRIHIDGFTGLNSQAVLTEVLS